jgi:peptidyl-prolyl cis-trans isomerase C
MRLALILVAVAVLSACDKPGAARVDYRRPRPAVSSGAWVARFSGDSLSEGELNQRFAEMNPYARARYQTVEQRREYVEGLVRYELLAQEAVRRGLANDPEVVEAARRVMVQQLLRKDVEEGAEQISDAQVKAYYAQHKDDFVKPAMTRLSHIFFTSDHEAKAEEVFARAKALQPMDYAGFAALAREHDEDERTRPLEGDLRFLSDEELTRQLGPEVATAAAALTQVGQVGPTLVKTPKGFHILKLQGRQIALNLSVEQAKPSIQQVLINEGKQDRFKALVERLKKQAGYEVNEPALAGLVVDPKAPAAEAKGPTPGYLPAPTGPLVR